MKKKFLLLPCIADVAIATFVGKVVLDSRNQANSGLLIANIEALSEPTENSEGYFVFHEKHYNPVTNLASGKCYAYSYKGPGGKCPTSHDHGANNCCSITC